jgi:hypothetical protein
MSYAQDVPKITGAKGYVYRPLMGPGPHEYIQMSRPGKYSVSAGDTIEIAYHYGQANPNPKFVVKAVSSQVTKGGSVIESESGIRVADDSQTATGRVIFSYTAKKVGNDTVTVVIDGAKYTYEFEVKAARK